jgi:hypothetical protein
MSVLTLTGSISIGKSLVDLRPVDIPDYVEKAADKLAAAVEAAENALADRLDRRADLGLERSFDILVDRIWVSLRARLEFWSCYRHDGLGLLNADEHAKLDLENSRKLAVIAEELLARLFGDGVEFLRLPYPEQAAHMAARLRYVESRGLEDELGDLVDVRLITLAKICQRRYEAMVAERSARDTAVSIDLRPLRAKIRTAAENYASLLLSTLDDGDEEWAKTVLTALRPMLTPGRSRAQDEEDESEVADGFVGEPSANEAPPVEAPA